MKFTLFALAAAVAVTDARRISRERDQDTQSEKDLGRIHRRRPNSNRDNNGAEESKIEEFTTWVAQSGKNYGSNREFESRFTAW